MTVCWVERRAVEVIDNLWAALDTFDRKEEFINLTLMMLMALECCSFAQQFPCHLHGSQRRYALIRWSISDRGDN
ncbi:hypothetical protein BK663_28765 [Pseudomonas lini]|uniref:Uncharacterized protein n=1 Tax=Pseudomonas lini TaxID=163011 RepID=A0A423I7Y8_9PSED|nr:hypothetical protein BK663_28765 [Pseudomonas lini]